VPQTATRKRDNVAHGHAAGTRVRTLIVDDQAVFRIGLRLYFSEAMPALGPFEEADSLEAALALAGSRPSLAMLDASLEGRPTEENVSRLREAIPGCAVVTMASVADAAQAALALDAGARGVLLKTAPPEMFLTAARAALSGETWVQPELSHAVYAELSRRLRGAEESRRPATKLTTRQLEILRLIAMGLRNAEIAERLTISEQTVKTHVAAILRRLDVKSRLQAARVAIETRLAKT